MEIGIVLGEQIKLTFAGLNLKEENESNDQVSNCNSDCNAFDLSKC